MPFKVDKLKKFKEWLEEKHPLFLELRSSNIQKTSVRKKTTFTADYQGGQAAKEPDSGFLP